MQLRLLQGMAFSVAMNSKRSNAIVALLIASNFAEIKGVVLKRFDPRRLLVLSFQVCPCCSVLLIRDMQMFGPKSRGCQHVIERTDGFLEMFAPGSPGDIWPPVLQDIVERFHLVVALAFVLVEEMANNGRLRPDATLLRTCAYFFSFEIVIGEAATACAESMQCGPVLYTVYSNYNGKVGSWRGETLLMPLMCRCHEARGAGQVQRDPAWHVPRVHEGRCAAAVSALLPYTHHLCAHLHQCCSLLLLLEPATQSFQSSPETNDRSSTCH